MKNHQYIVLAIAGLVGLTTSCKRTLETVPVEQLTINYIFNPADSAGANADLFLSNVYTYMPTGWARIGATGGSNLTGDFLDDADDDGISSAVSPSPVDLMETGGLTPYYNPDDGFVNSYNPNQDFYTGIRLATEFIDNIDVVPVKGTLQDGSGRSVKLAWKAEARFIRAYCYFELLKRYGGIPLLGNNVYQLGANLNIPRSSFAACVSYISTELDSAVVHLRLDPVDAINYGRITEGAALALQSRLLLYAASPLYNGGNINPGNAITGYTDYDATRWKLAADAALAVETYGKFSLDANYTDLFTSDQNTEIILAQHVTNPANYCCVTTLEEINGPIGLGSVVPIAQGRTSPTQELVNAFGTINGKPITQDIQSTTNPKGFDIDTPFVNRDPRFYQTILYNGAPWMGEPLQTYDGGISKPGGTVQQTKTGYYLCKFMGNNANNTTGTYVSAYNNFISFRYGEILLNYAEAENEYLSSPDQTVYAALIQLRTRAGIAAGSDGNYGLTPGMTQDSMRQVIQNERRVEMSFEEQRFWDVRRWKIATKIYNVPLHGYDVVKNPYTGAFSGSVVPVLTTIFQSPKMYLYPIPYSQVVSNPSMKQNPGW